MTKKINTIVTSAADTVVIPASTMTRDRMLREAAQRYEAAKTARANDRAAALAVGAAEVEALMGMGAFCEPIKVRAGRRGGPRVKRAMSYEAQMALYNELAAQAIERGLKFRLLGKNGTTFATWAAGEAAIAKVQAALAV